MVRNSSITEELIKTTLFHNGLDAEDYFIVSGSPMTWADSDSPFAGMPMMHVIEDDQLSEACVAFLRSKGVPEYTAVQDAKSQRDTA